MGNTTLHGSTAYSLSSISWAFEPGAERIRTIADFDHSFSKLEDGFWVRVTDSNGQYVIPSVTYTPDSITWTATLPQQYINMTFDEIQAQKDAGTNEYVLEDFTFDIHAIEKANVLIFHFPENHNELRTYQPAVS